MIAVAMSPFWPLYKNNQAYCNIPRNTILTMPLLRQAMALMTGMAARASGRAGKIW